MDAPLPPQDLDHVLDHTRELWDDIRGQSIFLTGGTGFVGTWLLESLLWASDKLDLQIGIVALTRDPDKFRARAHHLADHRAVRLQKGSVIDFEFPDGKFPFVIHAATARLFEPNAAYPLGAFDADVAGTRHVLEFARQHGARRLLLTSSGAVYGRQPSGLTHIPEDYAGTSSTMDMSAIYGHAKRVSEFMCASYGHVYGFEPLIARLFAFVGPLLPLDAHYAVGNFIRDAIGGGPIRVAGDGTPYRSYLSAADLAIWLWTILFRGKAAFPYNVGSSKELTIADLAHTVVRETATNVEIRIARQPASGAPPLRYVPCAKRAEEELGLRSLVSVEEGIRRTVSWHRTAH
jgi:dTDP-glucose 4,6-dehydratase